ncbi:uncharacterized protein LOC143304811 [Bombus vancouverensis nearcticus]|uniref:uncharacterized protein LOC143304811 n=1 Tax=Bombus vancouverensis nearcticus TaxID=2705178 RepID=UPI00402B7F79
MSEKFSELPNKINNISAKELSDEAETRKLNDETTGNAYPLPNITEILDPLGSANCLSTFDLAKIQKQDSTNFVNVSTIIEKEIASASHSKTSIKPSEGNFIELKAKSLNCKEDHTIENKNIAIHKSKTESISKKVCNKNSKNNSKSTKNIPKRSLQINNNLITISTSSETIHPEKVEENKGVVNKVNKEEKGVTKEKDSKHFQAEETQVQRARRNQKGENRESPVEDISKNLNKYASHWIIIGLKILYWLLHLIFDVGNIVGSADLMISPGKYRWYHTILYTKYFWVNMAAALSKICILNAISKQLGNWINVSKPASWRKIKTKMKERNEILPARISFGHLAKEPIGEVTIEENTEPTCAEYLKDLFNKINTV